MEDRTIGQSIKYFLLSLLSRKFLLAIAGTIIAFDAALMDGQLSQAELITSLSPILAFLGVEGVADIKERG